MHTKVILHVFVFILFSFALKAQDCTLNVGGENSETLANVFQMNEMQKAQLDTLSIALKSEIESFEISIQKLFDEHPQSSTEELTQLASKYRVLQEKIVRASLAADTKLLSSFNERQYNRYLMLCNEAFRIPIRVVPLRIDEVVEDPD